MEPCGTNHVGPSILIWDEHCNTKFAIPLRLVGKIVNAWVCRYLVCIDYPFITSVLVNNRYTVIIVIAFSCRGAGAYDVYIILAALKESITLLF